VHGQKFNKGENMSTRANIVITDGIDTLWFYRHCDGYPEGTMPTLNKFLDLVKTKKIRDDIGQASGWLILIGAEEYNTKKVDDLEEGDWKVGAYEPTIGQHGDIEYLYTINLSDKTIDIKEI
jgi:hypothetical protein